MTTQNAVPLDALAPLGMAYGHRARIGSISPAGVNEIKPFEFYAAAPPGTTMVLTDLAISEVTQKQVDEAVLKIVDAGKELRRMSCDFIVIAGTPLVVMKPAEFEVQIIADLQAAVGDAPVTTSQQMELAGLRHLGMQRIVVASPWTSKINDPLEAYLQRQGFDVLAVEGVSIPLAERGGTAPERAYDLGARLLQNYPTADGLYIVCPNWPTLPAVPLLEERFNKPVLTGIAAFIWYPLVHLDKFEPVHGRGRLLAGAGVGGQL